MGQSSETDLVNAREEMNATIKTMGKRIYEIDGNVIDSLDGFYDEVGRRLLDNSFWGRGLDAFNDVLRGGFGTPDGGFVLRWLRSDRSRAVLGFPATIRYLEKKATRCHPSNVASVRANLARARRGEGETLFDILVDIIRTHGPDGRESESGVDLELA